jgi:hypothetical protein
MIPDAARDQVPILPDQLWTTRYEEMRERAMNKSSSIDHARGYALLIRRGLVAWMGAWPRPAQEPCDRQPSPRAAALTVPPHLLHSAASVLVNMIISLGTPTEVPHEQRCHEGLPQPT